MWAKRIPGLNPTSLDVLSMCHVSMWQTSTSQRLCTGVSQGSMLGPLLYAIYNMSISLLCRQYPTISVTPARWPHISALFISHPNQVCEKPGCHDWWPAILLWPCCVCLPVMLLCTQYATKLLVISRLGYCNSSGYPSMQFYKWSRMRQHIWVLTNSKGHFTPLLIELHLLPMAAWIM